jgi:hypothetical protein
MKVTIFTANQKKLRDFPCRFVEINHLKQDCFAIC